MLGILTMAERQSQWKAGDLLTTPEAAAELDVSEAWISQLCRDGRITGAVKRGRFWFIPYESLGEIEPRDIGRPSKTRNA